MIVPRNRLLVWVAMVVLPFALLGAVVPTALSVALLAIVLFLLLALIDATLAHRSLTGITVELPAISRLSREREGKVEVRIRNEPQRAREVRLGLPLPPEIESAQTDCFISLPASAEWSRMDWTCRPRKRGNYPLDTVYLEGASPAGFRAFRKAAPVRAEIRVYPNLFTERKNLAAMFLNRGAFGTHAQRQLGKGREFEKLREYIPGDGYDEVHWKATAKRGRPVTKVFQIERTQEVYVVIDASRLSARVSGEETILERFITAGLVLGLAAEQQGDLFGLLTFSDQVKTFVRAKNGKAHFSACRDALYTLHPQIVTPDYDELCTFIRLRLRHRALLVFLTCLDDPLLAESFVRNMDLLRRQHLVLVNMLQPPGVSPLFTNPHIVSVDDLYQHLGGHLLWQKLRELEKILQRRGVRFSLLQNERLSSDLVSQYLSVKQRQLI
jgi:uncharacterized protein (DUF58 family)